MTNPDIRWIQRYSNFERAFGLLREALSIENPSVVERAGLIQFFEMVFELSWKMMKDYEQAEGVAAKTPREVLKKAFQIGLIEEGHIWLDALDERKLTAHTYRDDAAQTIENRIRERYYPAIASLNETFKLKKKGRRKRGATSMNHGLIPRDLKHIQEAAAELEEIDQVILFGSRAQGTHDRGSDVDLSIRGNEITHDTILRLSRSLNEERPLPYFFDIVDYDRLEKDEPIKARIDRVGVVLFDTSQASRSQASSSSS